MVTMWKYGQDNTWPASPIDEDFWMRETHDVLSGGTYIRAMGEEFNPDLSKMIPQRYHEYLQVFDKMRSEQMPVKKLWDHEIELKEGFVPKKTKIYPMSPKEREEVEAFVEHQLKKGYIRPSKSPQTSPVFFVLKKEGIKRMIQDYRYINSWTVRNNYSIPLISDLVDWLKGAKHFTKLDLCWRYNNLQIKEADRWKAAFTTHLGTFEPNVMFFGLQNSLPAFQTMMNDLF